MTKVESMDPLTIALRSRRQLLRMSLERLGRKLHVSQSTVHAWESGVRNPSPTLLRAWADAVGCDLVLVPRRTVDELVDEPVDYVDSVAVERAVAGQKVPLTAAEQLAVAERMEELGASNARISAASGLAVRTVQRLRKARAA